MIIAKLTPSRFCLLACTLWSAVGAGSAFGATVEGEPVNRGGSYGCSFVCPAGVVRIERVDFDFSIAGVPLSKSDRDGGILICANERRDVGKVLPSVVGFFARIEACTVSYSGIGLGRDPNPGNTSKCEEPALSNCIQYGGGNACYDKYCR